MMLYKLILSVGIAAAIVLVVAIVGLLLLFVLREPAKQLGPSETVQQACDMLAENDHDAVIVATTGSEKTVYNLAFSGSNSHMTVELYVPDEDTAVGQFEHIFKDGVEYIRLNSRNTPDSRGPWEVVGTHRPQLYQNTPCFSAEGSSIEEATEEATEEAAGTSPSERRFVWYTGTAGESVEMNELWIDSTGRPLRGLVTVTEAPATSTGEVRSPSGIWRFETTYSGLGESNIITTPVAAPPLTPPRTPERPFGAVISPGTVALDWNDVPTATSYAVRFWLVSVNRYVELSPSGPVRGISITFNGSSAVISGLATSRPGHDGWYAFQVLAVNDAGSSAWSGNNHVPVSDPGAPDIPERPSGAVIRPGTVALDWNDAPTATSYAVRFWLVSIDRYVELSPHRPVRGISINFDGSSATISGLAKSRPGHDGWYAFQVRAINDAGSSAWSGNNRMPVP